MRTTVAGMCRAGRRLKASGSNQALAENNLEGVLSRYFHDMVAAGGSRRLFVLTRIRESLRVARVVAHLPVVDARVSTSRDGLAIRRALRRKPIFGVWRTHGLTAVLVVPSDAEGYCSGRSMQTLRRNVRKARESGLHCRLVDDLSERLALLDAADCFERSHPNEEYRRSVGVDRELLQYGLWLAAYNSSGGPLLLSVTPVDGEWAQLRYFRILSLGNEASRVRYLMMVLLVERLSVLGVKYLFDERSPAGLPNGLRQYQRSVGFRIRRVRLHRSRTGAR